VAQPATVSADKPRRFQFCLKALLISIVLYAVIWGLVLDHYALHLIEVGHHPIVVDYDRSIEAGVAAGKYVFRKSDFRNLDRFTTVS